MEFIIRYLFSSRKESIMEKAIKIRKTGIAVLLTLILLPALAQAAPNHRHGKGKHAHKANQHHKVIRHHKVINHHKVNNYHRANQHHRVHQNHRVSYYPKQTRCVTRLPYGASRISVGGITYWIHGGLYYKAGWNGYAIVNRPVEVVKVRPACKKIVRKTVDVYVPRKCGWGYEKVVLVRRHGGYVGPRGEYYHTMPHIHRLKKVYG